MKAILYNQFGGPEVLQTTSIANPLLTKSTAIVRVHAISLNPRDTSLRKGEFKFFTGSKFPKFIGADFSGTVEDIEENAEGFKNGDDVFGYIQDFNAAAGAELAVIPIRFLAKKPSAITHQEAATLGCAFLTALQALRDKIKIKTRERIMIYGAAGGVGTAAIQLAKHFGAQIISVSHSTNREYCLAQGANQFMAYDEQDIFTTSERVDAFFQVYSKDGSVYHIAKKLMARNGRFVCLIPNPLFIFHKIFSQPSFDYMLVRSNVQDLNFLADLAEKKILNPQICETFPIDQGSNAFRYLESGQIQGKVVLNLMPEERTYIKS